jgi:hypothetical protein
MLINNINIKKIKNYKIHIVLFLLFSYSLGFFESLYSLHIRDYDERNLRIYGECKGVSYGFIKKVKEKFLDKINIVYVINLETHPPSYSLFSDVKVDKDKTNLIILNFDKDNNQNLSNEDIDLSKYNLIFSEKNCFYYKKK